MGEIPVVVFPHIKGVRAVWAQGPFTGGAVMWTSKTPTLNDWSDNLRDVTPVVCRLPRSGANPRGDLPFRR